MDGLLFYTTVYSHWNKRCDKYLQVRLKKGLTSRLWEELILAIIGEQFDVGHEICGAVVSVRHSEDIISVWNKSADNAEATAKIRYYHQYIARRFLNNRFAETNCAESLKSRTLCLSNTRLTTTA
jgi:hypothetical protein